MVSAGDYTRFKPASGGGGVQESWLDVRRPPAPPPLASPQQYQHRATDSNNFTNLTLPKILHTDTTDTLIR